MLSFEVSVGLDALKALKNKVFRMAAKKCKKVRKVLGKTPTLKVVRSNRIGRTNRKALNHNGFRAFSFCGRSGAEVAWGTIWGTIAIFERQNGV